MTQKVRIHGEPSASHTDGIPLAINSDGSLNVSGGSVSGTVKVSDGTTPTQLLAIDASGRITAVLSSQAFTNAVLTNVADTTATHWLGTKDQALAPCISGNTVAVADSSVVSAVNAIPAFNGVVTPATITATLQNAATGTGTGTAMTVTAYKMVAISVVSTVVGAITYDFEVSVDGTNYMTGINVTDAAGVDWVGSITNTGAGTWVYQFMCAGVAKIQCNITANAATGGTSVTVKAQAVA